VLPAAGRWDDFASLMAPRGCVCMSYRNSSLDTAGRVAHMRALCASDPGPGVLAYVDDEPAGWCSVAPKSTHRALVNSRTIPHVQDEDAWSVVCFVVRPVDPGSKRVDQTSGYVGTVALFEAHGFTRVCQTAGHSGGKPRWLVRREPVIAA